MQKRRKIGLEGGWGNSQHLDGLLKAFVLSTAERLHLHMDGLDVHSCLLIEDSLLAAGECVKYEGLKETALGMLSSGGGVSGTLSFYLDRHSVYVDGKRRKGGRDEESGWHSQGLALGDEEVLSLSVALLRLQVFRAIPHTHLTADAILNALGLAHDLPHLKAVLVRPLVLDRHDELALHGGVSLAHSVPQGRALLLRSRLAALLSDLQDTSPREETTLPAHAQPRGCLRRIYPP